MENANKYLNPEYTCARGALDTQFAYHLLGAGTYTSITYADAENDPAFFAAMNKYRKGGKLELRRTLNLRDQDDSVLDVTRLELLKKEDSWEFLVAGSTGDNAVEWAIFPTPELRWERDVLEQTNPQMYLCEHYFNTRLYSVRRQDSGLFRLTAWVEGEYVEVGEYPDPEFAKAAAQKHLMGEL